MSFFQLFFFVNILLSISIRKDELIMNNKELAQLLIETAGDTKL